MPNNRIDILFLNKGINIVIILHMIIVLPIISMVNI